MCDPDTIARDRQQLWAEAREQFKAHGVLHEQAERLAENEHADFAEHDEWDNVIFKWLHTPDFAGTSRPFGRDFLTAGEVLAGALDLPKGQHGRPQLIRVKKSLIRQGYTYENIRIHGVKTRGFVPPSLF
jgi:predicted P-loop ATPase